MSQLNSFYMKKICKYIKDIKDYMNIIQINKKYRNTFDLYKTNPITLTKTNRKFFSEITTQKLYNQFEIRFYDGKIEKRKLNYLINYSNYLNEKENGNECNFITFSLKDRKKYGQNIPENIYRLEEKTFQGNLNLFEISLPNSIQKIGQECFSDCSSLKEIKLSDKLKIMGFKSFAKTWNLTKIEIPSTIQKISSFCFLILV